MINVDNFGDINVSSTGKYIENDGIFPEKTNVEFVKVSNNRRISVKVWERGSGLTHSCGTGACASVAACAVNGFVPFDKEITVKMKGGELSVRVNHDLSVVLIGDAHKVYDGVVEI